MDEDNATSWRDLADQLDPRDIQIFEDSPLSPEKLLASARRRIASRLREGLYADVALPTDAYHGAACWDEDDERVIFGTDRDGVVIYGAQRTDGSVRARWIEVDHIIDKISATKARKYAADLIAAADELDALEARQW
jgi:hypothetical protein